MRPVKFSGVVPRSGRHLPRDILLRPPDNEGRAGALVQNRNRGRIIMSWAASSWAAWSRRLGLCAVIGVCAAVAAASEAAAGPDDIGIVITNSAYDSSTYEVPYAENDGKAMVLAMQQVMGIDKPQWF